MDLEALIGQVKSALQDAVSESGRTRKEIADSLGMGVNNFHARMRGANFTLKTILQISKQCWKVPVIFLADEIPDDTKLYLIKTKNGEYLRPGGVSSAPYVWMRPPEGLKSEHVVSEVSDDDACVKMLALQKEMNRIGDAIHCGTIASKKGERA